MHPFQISAKGFCVMMNKRYIWGKNLSQNRKENKKIIFYTSEDPSKL